MKNHFPDNVIKALIDALINVFWLKKDLRSLYERCGVPSSMIAAQDWSSYKYHIIEPVLSALNSNEEGLAPLRRILAETLNYKDGDHLLWLQDGKKRKREAERCLEHLRLLVQQHDEALHEAQEEQARRRAEAEKTSTKRAFNERLRQLRDRFLILHQQLDSQGRGYGLETFLHDLFDLFELQPRGAFKVSGEQIDGAFVQEGDHFLLEAKWQKSPVTLDDLRDLDGAVASNLDNTLGLFVAINGFSSEALDRYRQGSRPRLLCMDGADLMAVLEGQIDLGDLLHRKRAVAAQRGQVFAPVREIMQGKL